MLNPGLTGNLGGLGIDSTSPSRKPGSADFRDRRWLAYVISLLTPTG